MSTTREKFVARFGEDNAWRAEMACESHIGINPGHANDDRGPDPFQYVLLGVIGWECISRFAEQHGFQDITAEEFRQWCLAEADLANYEGDVPDLLAMASGIYLDFVVRPS